MLADGSETTTNVYVASVEWDGGPRQVFVEEASTAPLAGMMLLDGYDLHVACTPGGRVAIERLAS